MRKDSRMDTQTERDVTQLKIAFHSNVNAATNELSESMLGNTIRWNSEM
jgi:hypothetical protein